jgi:fatty acid desaturase
MRIHVEVVAGHSSRDRRRDYSLVGRDSELAVQLGLAAAGWYHSDIPRKRMKELMRRRDFPAIQDTVIWVMALAAFGFGGYWFWGSWSCVPFFLCYGVLYGTASNSRWHEAGHGTAFRTAWMNDVLYQVASFMTLQEPTVTRWSHTRHHTDTIIVGRDPEIAPMRPPHAVALVLEIFGIRTAKKLVVSLIRHARGSLTSDEAVYLPITEHRRVFREARIWLLVYLLVIGAAIVFRSLLPLMYIGLPSLYGRWLLLLFALSQHGGLAENVLDHRLNSRTIYMNPIFRFIYWNMNYHVEHHMFPMVPYHALPALHAEIRDDLPRPCRSLPEAYRKMLPVLWRQRHDPECYLRPVLPPSAKAYRPDLHGAVVGG